MSVRTCTKCSETKELNDKNFCKSKRYVGGLTRWCRVCANKYRNTWALGDRMEWKEHVVSLTGSRCSQQNELTIHLHEHSTRRPSSLASQSDRCSSNRLGCSSVT